MLRQMFGSEISLRTRVARQPLPVRLDRSQFELMILNIAANARDATGAGGYFHIDLSCVRQGEADMVCIRLADNGQGMTEEVLRRVFDPFYSTKPADSGTGIGLSVVRDLVKYAGGRIEVDSRPGGGTTFTILLPMASETEAATLPADSTPHPPYA